MHKLNLKPKQVAKVSAVVFGIIALLHLLRFLTQVKVVAAGLEVPVWLSLVVVLFAGWLSFENWKSYKK
jgi:hypothetical protein